MRDRRRHPGAIQLERVLAMVIAAGEPQALCDSQNGCTNRNEFSMWATFDLDDARRQLDQALRMRVHAMPVAEDAAVVRCPVGFFFIRGDRAGPGKDLAEQVVASYGY
jgi:hypothetical protein